MFIIFWFVLLLFIITSIALVGLVLLQEPKNSGGMGDALGGGGAENFNSVGGVASGLHNLTVWLGVIWGVLALALAIIPRG